MGDDGEKYIVDGRLNIDLVRVDHTPDRRAEWCEHCGEEWPCSITHAADRIEDFRSRRGRR